MSHGSILNQAGAGYTQEEVLSNTAKEMFGLSEDATPNDIFEILGKYNWHWWKRRTNGDQVVLGPVAKVPLFSANATNGGRDVSYSSNVDISNGLALAKPVSTVHVTYNTYINAATLRNKYWIRPRQTTIYYSNSNAEFSRLEDEDADGSSYYQVFMQGQQVSVQTVVGDWEYVCSSSRSAYPDSGITDGYEYQYLGIPFDKMINIAV